MIITVLLIAFKRCYVYNIPRWYYNCTPPLSSIHDQSIHTEYHMHHHIKCTEKHTICACTLHVHWWHISHAVIVLHCLSYAQTTEISALTIHKACALVNIPRALTITIYTDLALTTYLRALTTYITCTDHVSR